MKETLPSGPTPAPARIFAARARITGLPRDLLQRSKQRLGTAALLYGLGYLLAIVVAEYVYHVLGRKPFDGWNVGYTVALVFMMVSLGVYGLTRSDAVPSEQMLTIGLTFEVIGAFGIILGTVADTRWQVPFPSVGIPWTCAWILFFPFIVPAPPGRSAVAAFLSALMGPIGLVSWHLLTNKAMPPPQIFGWLTFPALICAGVATVGANIVYGLGAELDHERMMGSYRLEELLRKGGMGEIWRGRHEMLARPAAIKLISPEHLGSPEAAKAAVARFDREAQETARLSSPHTVRLYDYGISEDGTFYYVMELLEGMDLDRLVRSYGPVEPERAVHFLIQACRSLAEAHESGVIHRDIKPANLFACRQGIEHDFLKVLDFGLVRPSRDHSSATPLTLVDHLVGTPAYLAPEAAVGGLAGPASDIYSLACVGYWLITGCDVFEADSPLQVAMSHVRDQPVRPCQRILGGHSIHDELENVLMTCLDKNPARRPSDGHCFIRVLQDIHANLKAPWTQGRAESWWLERASAT